MPLLTPGEALDVSDSFLHCLYGEEIFMRWRELKLEMSFVTERDYVSWLMDVAMEWKGLGGGMDGNIDNINGVEEEEYGIGNVQSNAASYNDVVGNNVTLSASASATQYDDTATTVKLECEQWQQGQPSPTDCHFPPRTIATNNRPTSSMEYVAAGASDTVTVNNSDYTTVRGDAAICNYHLVDKDSQIDDVTTVSVRGEASAAEAVGSKRFRCPHCTYGSNYGRGDIERHIAGVHSRRKTFTCQYCRYQCVQKAHLKSHLVLRHGVPSNYVCGRCARYFTTPKSLRVHSRTCCS